MDSQDQQPQPEHGGNAIAVHNNATATAAATNCCKGGGMPLIGGNRQTSTRWTPTAEQIRILRDLYYNYGVRSPNAEQIQRISARLRQFGKIEGKNVFYWFQNHKARERQKKRLASDPTFHHSPGLTSSAHYGAVLTGSGQMGSYRYGSLAMEKKFTECSLSASSSGGLAVQRVGWAAAMDPPLYASSSYCNVLGNRYHCSSSNNQPQEEGEDEEDGEKVDDDNDYDGREIETLPLFPMRDNEDSGGSGSFFGVNPSPNPGVPSAPSGLGQVGYNSGVGGAWHGDVVLMAKPRASSSLELSLSSSSPASF